MEKAELIEQLRAADEDTVEAALEGSYVDDVFESVAPDALVEFFQRMIDVLVEPRDG